MIKVGKDLVEKVVPKSENPSIFLFIDCVMGGERFSSFKYLKELLESEEPIKIVNLLESHFKRISTLKNKEEDKEHNYYVEKVKKQADSVSHCSILKSSIKVRYSLFRLKGLDTNYATKEQILNELVEDLLEILK
jgi:DNA polymerase III delta subunit